MATRSNTRVTPLSRANTRNTMLCEVIDKGRAELAEQTDLCAKAIAERNNARDEVRGLADRLSNQRQTSDARVADLKALIASLEQQLAESRGYARALNERLEHDSPLVEVPQMTTRAQLVRGVSPGFRDRAGFAETRDTERRKHWTAI